MSKSSEMTIQYTACCKLRVPSTFPPDIPYGSELGTGVSKPSILHYSRVRLVVNVGYVGGYFTPGRMKSDQSQIRNFFIQS